MNYLYRIAFLGKRNIPPATQSGPWMHITENGHWNQEFMDMMNIDERDSFPARLYCWVQDDAAELQTFGNKGRANIGLSSDSDYYYCQELEFAVCFIHEFDDAEKQKILNYLYQEVQTTRTGFDFDPRDVL